MQRHVFMRQPHGTNCVFAISVFAGLCFFASQGIRAFAQNVGVGSKAFTESVILGEICAQSISASGTPCDHTSQLGGTQILWNALKAGEIDAYPDYTGTIAAEILKLPTDSNWKAIRDSLAKANIKITQPIGFNNSYAIGMLRSRAAELGISKISDFAKHPNLSFGLSNEFMDRDDGWPGLSRAYQLNAADAKGIEHALAYRAVQSGAVDAIDLYTTDAEIALYNLVTLEDDRSFFPSYEAVILYRADLDPHAARTLEDLAGRINATQMRQMNRKSKVDRMTEANIATEFLRSQGVQATSKQSSLASRLWKNTMDHLVLVAISLGLAIIVAIPLGIFAFKWHAVRQPVLAMVGLLQTIPSLALLVILIPLFGIGTSTALVALFLYSLLPIVRNTVTGLSQIPDHLRETSELLGLTPWQRLRKIELPLAMPSILAGVKTAAVINVGTATIGALIGAGGYGQPILTGIRLDDTRLILEGAVPAAIMAIGMQLAFEALEYVWLPRGLRASRS